jgi:hypothetical protein
VPKTPIVFVFFLYDFFYQGIPLPTANAFASPFCRLSSTVLAEKGCFGF